MLTFLKRIKCLLDVLARFSINQEEVSWLPDVRLLFFNPSHSFFALNTFETPHVMEFTVWSYTFAYSSDVQGVFSQLIQEWHTPLFIRGDESGQRPHLGHLNTLSAIQLPDESCCCLSLIRIHSAHTVESTSSFTSSCRVYLGVVTLLHI